MSTLPLFDRLEPRVLRVSEVNRLARLTLEEGYRDIWVEGELSDVTKPASGHVYFTLNDTNASASVRGAIFRADARRSKVRFENGEQVRLRGGLSLYEPRGSFQIIARLALPAQLSDKQAEFERVRLIMEKEGLLDPARKRPLPFFPSVVGVVTSPNGAAVHDIIRVASARGAVRIVISPCVVQGENAAASIVQALLNIQQLADLDVIIVGRGGGAKEDLRAFNDESVARAIAETRVPVVSAVGHEIDITVADLVADVRAATPSNAAELVVPEHAVLEASMASLDRALARAMEMNLGRERLRVERMARRLGDPRHILQGYGRKLEVLEAHLSRGWERSAVRSRQVLNTLRMRLTETHPHRRLSVHRARLTRLASSLQARGDGFVAPQRAQLGELAARLNALSPLSVLGRGYAIALAEKSGKAVLRASDVQVGEKVRIIVSEGTIHTKVERT